MSETRKPYRKSGDHPIPEMLPEFAQALRDEGFSPPCSDKSSLFEAPDFTSYIRAASICFSCDIRRVCLQEGKSTKAHGVWGGELLRDGRIVRPSSRRAAS